MLLERGPIEPIDVGAQFRASSLPSLVSSVSSVTQNLAGVQASLGAQLSTMASDDSVPLLDGIVLDLATVNDELARQAGALDSSIGDVAVAAGEQEAQLPGLTSDVASDLSTQNPSTPDYVDHAFPPGSLPTPPRGEENPPEQPPEPPTDEFPTLYDAIARLYRELLDRDGSSGEIEGWVATGLSIGDIRQAFLDSPEYREKHGG